jgi:hypothetical protein
MQAASHAAPAVYAGTIGLAARIRGGRGSVFSIDAGLSLTVSFLSSKEKKCAIRWGGKRGTAFEAIKNSKKILTPRKS